MYGAYFKDNINLRFKGNISAIIDFVFKNPKNGFPEVPGVLSDFVDPYETLSSTFQT